MENITKDMNTNTTIPDVDIIPAYWGFISLAISIIFYGSFLLPVKKYNTGDGMFFQLILCFGIWSVSYVVNWIRAFPTFYALPMLGGLIWTTGNVTAVPIIKFIGLALGMLIWGTVSLVVGWANARFGWFGIIPQVPKTVWMNYVGVAFAIASGVFYVFVKTNVSEDKQAKLDTPTIKTPNIESEKTNSNLLEKINPNLRRLFGIVLAIIAGTLYGLTYAPYTYVVDHYKGASNNGLDYVFSFYSGILMSSIIYYIIYSIVRKNNPFVNIQAILPSYLSGLMWGVANCCFLVANSSLSQAVTFPIGASGPPMIASLHGIFIFKEIKGNKNFVILIIGFVFTLVGAIFSGLSK